MKIHLNSISFCPFTVLNNCKYLFKTNCPQLFVQILSLQRSHDDLGEAIGEKKCFTDRRKEKSSVISTIALFIL